ncbi:AI-2E family transporter [Indioceanicola profundi]|uniref:AI-2E family transporter n=1 Tax=Indioceanicola profundi TaxID=2220096 RepID=UPI000E6AA457|nr:AI-2E family transporter [Indioceanicola profundi]
MFSESTPHGGISDRTFVRRALILFLMGVVATVLWIASHALVLLFGAILFAVIFRGLANLLTRWTGLPDTPAVAAVLVLLLAVLAGFGWLFGSQVSNQFSQLAERIPTSLSQIERQIGSTQWGRELLERTGGLESLRSGGQQQNGGSPPQGAPQGQGGGQEEGNGAPPQPAAGGSGQPKGAQPQGGSPAAGDGVIPDGAASSIGWLVRQAGSLLMTIVDGATQFVLVLFGAIFLAFQPGLYRAGVAKLVPHDETNEVRKVLDRTGDTLWLWAAGQLAEMVIIGILTGVGLWLMGVPAPLALGLIAGLLEFIPFAGPILAAIPGVLLALTVSPTLALWTILFYLFLQQLEGNVIMPVVQRKAVSLPPVVGIFALLVFGSLFGPIGVLFAVPMAVAVMTIVQVVYVKDTLHKDVEIGG